ncbi:MAG TPA: CRISPR-associated endonuclease Cas1 [Planctomycetes bacterium]|nr:CRISPR-associated endonuclease Cas1 [Planctomycetota bacterium]
MLLAHGEHTVFLGAIPVIDRRGRQPYVTGFQLRSLFIEQPTDAAASWQTRASPLLATCSSPYVPKSLHVVAPRATVTRSGESLVVKTEDGTQRFPIQEIDAVLVHGFGQVTTQPLHLCAHHDIPVVGLTAGGRFVAGTATSAGRVQQRIRQYQAFQDSPLRLRSSQQRVHAKVETQLRYGLRATRGDGGARGQLKHDVERMRECLHKIAAAPSIDSLRGLEGNGCQSLLRWPPRYAGPSGARCAETSGPKQTPTARPLQLTAALRLRPGPVPGPLRHSGRQAGARLWCTNPAARTPLAVWGCAVRGDPSVDAARR